MTQDIPTLRRQLEQLKELHESGVLQAEPYEEGKVALERRIVDLVMSGAADAPSSELAAAPSQNPEQIQSHAANAMAPAAKRSSGLMAGLAVAVVAVASAGYWYMGSPDQLNTAPSSNMATGPLGEEKMAPHATSQDEIANMAAKLAERMKGTPEDAEGWAMLARSYTVLGRHPEALVAYEKAVNLRKSDAPLLADYADSLAVSNGRNLAGEPMKWVNAALKIDPQNPKALALAGTHAFDTKDYASAVKYWDQVAQFGPADSEYVKQVQAGLAEARKLGGMPPAPASKPAEAATNAPAVLPGSAVSGTVTLAPALAQLASPDDTVFIYARAAEGGQRMPLAIQRRQVKDLPFKFTLDDSSSMSPAARISGAKNVIVSARITKSGQATPAPGDLTGQSAPVAVGEMGLAIEIRDQVK
jgi:cytochrome c-type biogenesis protein CcmH